VPERSAHPVRCLRAPLLASVDRAAMLTEKTKDGKGITLEARGTELTIIGRGLIGEIEDSLDILPHDRSDKVSCNAMFLRDALAAMGADEIELHIYEPGAPMLLRERGESPDLIVIVTYRG
jgi:DNA polymerase III sliding clamp (beta) subunit (PCNA family)